jgi:hypothetical protein
MTKFSDVTAFRLVRGLGAAGARNPAIYLLICDAESVAAVEADLRAEAEVQLGAAIRVDTASDVLRNSLPLRHDGSIRLIYFDQWLPELVEAMDKHSALLVQDGGQLLLLADGSTVERILKSAPNLRSRLTDVFRIGPDDLSRGLPI